MMEISSNSSFSSTNQPRRYRRTRLACSLSVSDKFHFAAALNKGGISLLGEGRVCRALGLFQQALLLCGEAVRQLDDKTCSETAPIHGPECSVQEQCIITTVGSSTDEEVVVECTTTNHLQEAFRSHDGGTTSPDCQSNRLFSLISLHYIEKVASKYAANGFVDWKALKLNNPESRIPEMHSFFLLSFVATYNVALCHQFQGICFATGSSASSRKQSLNKATKSYEIMHHMMAEEEELQSEPWMLLLLMNNLSRVLLCVGDTKRASLCCQRLISILMYVVDHEDMLIPSVLFENYFSNVSNLILGNSRTAAAA